MKYAVYTLTDAGDLYEVQYLTSSKGQAKSYMQSVPVINDPYIVTFEDCELVPAMMEIE